MVHEQENQYIEENDPDAEVIDSDEEEGGGNTLQIKPLIFNGTGLFHERTCMRINDARLSMSGLEWAWVAKEMGGAFRQGMQAL